MRPARAAIPALLTLVATLAGCTDRSSTASGDAGAARQSSGSIATDPRDSMGPAPEIPGAHRGGTVTILRETPIAHLDPQRLYSFVGLNASQLYARRLTTFADDGQGHVTLVGDLAETPGTDVNHDCRIWDYRIKDGVKFEDGSTITAADVAYGIARSFDLSLTGGPTYIQEWLADDPQFDARFDFQAGKSDLPPGLAVLDHNTLRFTFARPRCDLPFAASLPSTAPVPASRDRGTAYDKHPVSSGPYKITVNTPGVELRLERNRSWDPATDAVRHQYPDAFRWSFGSDPVAQTNRIIADNGSDRTAISWDGVDPSMVSTVVGDPGLASRVISSPTSSENTLTINNQRVTDIRVRRALNYAIDRDGLIKALGGETVARPVTTLMPPSTMGSTDYDAYPAGRNGDPGRAKEILHGATPRLVLAYPDNTTGQTVGTYLENNLARAGFDIVLKAVPADAYLDEIGRKDNPWDLYLGSWAADWPSGAAILPVLYDGRAVKADGSNNATSYLDAPALYGDFDRVLTLPAAEQAPEWATLSELIMRDYAPVVPLYVDAFFGLRGADVEGVFIDSVFGYPTFVNTHVNQ